MYYTVHGILQSSPGDLPNLGIELRSPTLQADSLSAEPQGKSKNAGVSSLSLLQRIFLTQESNRGLLNYRWILYQLSYQGNPRQRRGFFYIMKFHHYMVFIYDEPLRAAGQVCLTKIGAR